MRKIKKILSISMSFIKYLLAAIIVNVRSIDNSKIWLISERGDDARDNAYTFYKYLKKEHPEQQIKYVISANSKDSSKINEEDIVKFNSLNHYIYFLTSGFLISTHIMGCSPNMSLFSRLDKKGLLKVKGKKIFLQHGITLNDIEINNYSLDLITTVSTKETNAMIKSNPKLKAKIAMTGFSRYDNLNDESKNRRIILYMPTFRKWLNFTSNKSFLKTEYYKRTNSILNNKKLDVLLKKYNYKLYFYPHYEIQKRIKAFTTSSSNKVIADFDNYDVQDLLKKSKILVTDYSSVFFDFSYMNKPVIYYQFDKNEYYTKHYKKGYFNFKEDGFGPVVEKEEELINEINEIISNNCINKTEYAERSKLFFAIKDKHNSDRIYKEITKIKNE